MADELLNRIVRIVPPRVGKVRCIHASNVTTVVELDNDIFQFVPSAAASPLGANVVGRPGNYGRALMRVQAEGNDVWVLFSNTNAIVCNSAANTGANVCARIPNGTGTPDGDIYEINPDVDLFMGVCTQNGTSNTANVRYWIVSFPTEYR